MKYKKYPKYKDSGVEWIGEIPEGWNTKRIRYCLENHKQGFYSEEEYIDDGVKLVRITDIDDLGNINFQKMPFVKISTNDENSFKVNNGDFLFARSGTIGRFGLAENVERSVFASYLIRFRFNNFSPNFLKLVFLSDYFKESLISSLHGGANKNIHAENIKEINIVFPISIKEQDSIFECVDPKLLSFDELIAKSKEQITILEEKKQATINEAVTKGLDPSVPMKDSGVEWIGEIPEGWEVRKLKFLAKRIQTGSTPPTNNLQYYENGKIDWYSPGDFNGNIILKNSDKKINQIAIQDGKARLFEKNSVLLIGIGATTGKTALVDRDFSTNQQINVISFRSNFNYKFGVYFLSTLERNLRENSNKATLPIFTQSQTKKIIMTLPPKEEQDQISEFLDKQTSQFDELITKSKQQITILEEKRQALITAAVTGKIDVRN